MVLVELVFHHGGKWTSKLRLMYKEKYMHINKGFDSDLLSSADLVDEFDTKFGYIGVQQLIVKGPAKECEPTIDVPNIVTHGESHTVEVEAASDYNDNDSEENDSDSPELSSDELEQLFLQKRRDINDKLTDYKELDRSMTFKDIPEARKMINIYSLANGYDLQQVKSDPTRLRYIYVGDFPFVCHISKDSSGGGVKFKTLEPKHTCEPAFENQRVDANTIAAYFKKGLQDNPKIKVREMRASLKAAYNVNVSESKCKRANKMILEKLEGSFTDEYNKLVAYANELKLSNPGSDVIINLSKDALEEGKRRFLRMYICFQAMKSRFKSGLRPFIGLDGTFLKGKAKGQLLVAVGQDSANHFYPLAWAIVEKETKLTWKWFLDHLQTSLDLKIGEGVTFISDMQYGLIESIQTVLPESHFRFCVRHIEANWCKRWGSGDFKKYLWWAAWSTYEEDFKDQIKNKSQVDDDGKEAVEDLLKCPPKCWSRTFFDTVCKNQSVDNNLTESFNAWILQARHKPIIKMLKDIRIKVMNMINEREAEVMTWGNEYSPKTMELYNQFMRIALKCHVNGSADNGYEVTESSDRHIVNLRLKKCTCRAWDFCGIPCPHAICALLHKKVDPLSQIHWYLTKETYHQTYSHKLQLHSKGKQPIGGKKKGQQTKRKRTLLDEADDEQPRSPSPAPVPQEATDEKIPLSAPQPSQHTQTSQSSNLLFMPTPSVQRKEPSCSAFPDFDYLDFDPEPEPKIAIRPRSISEAKTRLQLRQLQSTTIGTREQSDLLVMPVV
ncbi:PREDICTED: uncharacterized protein LOC109213902 [Nicotiana attenuata]|uniref:uncharacterized protein LOC109213902 n=1 Tax=Nicotiana attenuata TaxID=49451 RepID=UPI0009047A86|nr:PREDICTED: uncharacterized protein LOC109213902 [Nicotiana attenuata]